MHIVKFYASLAATSLTNIFPCLSLFPQSVDIKLCQNKLERLPVTSILTQPNVCVLQHSKDYFLIFCRGLYYKTLRIHNLREIDKFCGKLAPPGFAKHTSLNKQTQQATTESTPRARFEPSIFGSLANEALSPTRCQYQSQV